MEKQIDIIKNDVHIHKNGYSGYITATRLAGEILEVQVMLCENGAGRKLSWFQKRWYTENEVIIGTTQYMWNEALEKSKSH